MSNFPLSRHTLALRSRQSPRKKTTGKPAQLKGYLIPRPVDAGKPEHKQFPYEVVGRMKRHREKKEENAPSNSNDNNKPSEYKEWSCPACTCRNKGDAQVCVACGTKSPPRTKLAQKGQNPSAFQGWIDQAGALMYGWYGVARREEAWIGRKVHVESGSQNFFSADSTTAAYVGEDFEAHYGSFVTSSSSLKTAGLPAVHQKFSSTHNGFALAGAAKVVDGALLELGTIIAGETVPTDNLPGAVWSTSKFDVSRSLSIAFSMPPMDEAIVDRAARVVFLSGSWWNIDPLRLIGGAPGCCGLRGKEYSTFGPVGGSRAAPGTDRVETIRRHKAIGRFGCKFHVHLRVRFARRSRSVPACRE